MTTQFASASYQEIVDLHTESDTVSVIGIHTPQGDTPRKMFGGFFDQFKKFKYLGCSISLVPAARLPADPLQVSYDAGEATIDPRDMLNPLMFHGCHGNDMGVILNRLYALNSADRNSDSVDFVQNNIEWSLADIAEGKFPNFQLEELYYKALTDNTWKKAHPQRGFRKSGLRPLVYKMATNLQMFGSGSSLAGEVGVDGIPMGPVYDSGSISLPVTQSGRQFFTPGLTGLGWLDTRNVLTDYKPVEIDLPITEEEIPDLEAAIRNATLAQQNASESSLPLVYMGMILLPPAYKTEQYFRMVINHHFAFKDFRGISFSNNLAVTPAYDNFNADESDDPDDPDPPSPPEPDPPVSGANVLVDLTDAGTFQIDGQPYDIYSTINASDSQDHVVTVENVTVNSKGFIVKQSDRLNQNPDPLIGYHAYISPAVWLQIVESGSYNRYNTNNIYMLNGKYYLYDIGSSTMKEGTAIITTSSQQVKFNVSPAFTELSDVVGSTTPLEDVSYGS